MSAKRRRTKKPDREGAAARPRSGGSPGGRPRSGGDARGALPERRSAVALLSSPWFWPAVILAVGLVLRFVYVFQVRHTPFFQTLGLDAKYYDAWAHAMAGGNAEREAYFMSPLYPWLLSIIYRLFGRDFLLVRLIQGVLGSLTGVLTYLIGVRVFGKRTGVIAGLVVATYGALVFYDGSLVMSPLLVFLNALGLYLLVLADERRTPWIYGASGVAFGVAAIGRASSLLFVPVAAVWVWLSGLRAAPDGPGSDVSGTRVRTSAASSRKRTAIRVAALVLGAIVVVAPVTLRNYVVADDFVMITSNGGLNFYIGNSEISTGGYVKPDGLDTENDVAGRALVEAATGETGLKPSELSSHWYRLARAYIAREPRAWLKLTVRKLSFAMSSYELPQIENYYFQKRYSGLLRAPLPGFSVVAPLGLLGLAVSLRRRRSLLLSLFLVTYVTSIVAFFVVARYRLPIVPVLAIGAAFAVEELRRLVSTNRWRAVVASGVGIACFAFLVNANLYAVDRSKAYAQPHFRLGVIHTERGDIETATDEYRTAIAIDPDYVKSYLNLGALLSQQGEDREAAEVFREAISRRPDYSAARVNLAMLLERSGDYEGALAQTDTVLAAEPENASALRERGVTLYRMGRFDEAERALTEAVERDFEGTERAEARFYMSLIAGGGRPEMTAASRAAVSRADSLLETGKIVEALSELETAAAESPHSAEPLTRIAAVKRGMGLMDEAVAAMRRAVELDPTMPGGHFNLGILLSDAGAHEAAIREYESELRIDPTFAPAHLNLALTHRFHFGNLNRATYHYRAYRDMGGAPVDALEELLSGD